MSGHRFQFENLAKLDNPRRVAEEPPERLVPSLSLEPDSLVLDVGVGAGYFALPVALRLNELNGKGQVIGLDLEPRMLEEFTLRAVNAGLGDRVRTIEPEGGADGEIPLADRSVDLVLMGHVYHEIADTLAYLRQIHRVLKPGGALFVVDWHPELNLDHGPPPDHRVAPETVIQQMGMAEFAEAGPVEVYEGFYVVKGLRG